MVSWESRRDTLPGNMLGREMPGAACRRENTREASCRTLSLIFGAPQSVGRTLLQRGMIAVDWHALADEARCFDPTSLGARSSTPQRVNRLRGTVGQEHSGHEAMLIARAAAHESSRVLDSSGSSTRNTEAPPEFLCRRTCDAITLVWISIGVLPPTPADGNQMNATNAATPWSKPSSRPPPVTRGGLVARWAETSTQPTGLAVSHSAEARRGTPGGLHAGAGSRLGPGVPIAGARRCIRGSGVSR